MPVQAKATKITEAFQKWIFAEDTRREALVTEFNLRFNSLVAPKHRGDYLTLPGLSDKFEPHFYQRDAVARIIAEPTVLLDHVVGAGKTRSMLDRRVDLQPNVVLKLAPRCCGIAVDDFQHAVT